MTTAAKQQWCLGSLLRLGFLLIVVSLLSLTSVVDATDVKWTPAENNNEDNRAATAPRSQKYWDEHGIERPDYAKTDAEIAFERGEVSGGIKTKIFWLGASIVILGFAVHHYFGPIPLIEGGSRLGGNHSWMDRFRQINPKHVI